MSRFQPLTHRQHRKTRYYRASSLLPLAAPLLVSCTTTAHRFELGLPVDNYGKPQSAEFVERFNRVYEELRAKHPEGRGLETTFVKRDLAQGSDVAK